MLQLSLRSLLFQPLRVSGQQTRMSRPAFLRCQPLHEHHVGALRPVRHLPDPGHQRLPGGLQHLPHPLRRRQRRLLHQSRTASDEFIRPPVKFTKLVNIFGLKCFWLLRMTLIFNVSNIKPVGSVNGLWNPFSAANQQHQRHVGVGASRVWAQRIHVGPGDGDR